MAILAKVRANKKKNGEANEDKPKKGDLRKTEEIKCEMAWNQVQTRGDLEKQNFKRFK